MDSKWISVKDRPPKRHEEVLVCVKNNGKPFVDIAEFTKEEWTSEDINKWKKWGFANGYYLDSDVEYWMPLPEPPKEE